MAGRAIQFLKQHQALQLLIQPAGFKSRQHDTPWDRAAKSNTEIIRAGQYLRLVIIFLIIFITGNGIVSLPCSAWIGKENSGQSSELTHYTAHQRCLPRDKSPNRAGDEVLLGDQCPRSDREPPNVTLTIRRPRPYYRPGLKSISVRCSFLRAALKRCIACSHAGGFAFIAFRYREKPQTSRSKRRNMDSSV